MMGKLKNIKPTSEKDIYIVEDDTYLLIEAIRELSHQIGRLVSK